MAKKEKELVLVKVKTRRIKPEIGQKFGNYTVVTDEIATDGKKTYWLVECICGKQNFVRSDILKANQATKCRNCSNKEKFQKNVDLGKMHSKGYSPAHQGEGDLCKSLYYTYTYRAKKRNIVFDQENVTIKYLWELLQKQNFTCPLSGIHIYLRGEDKTIPLTDNGNPRYELFNASLDRIDSSKGYIVGNVQWVHRKVNMMKNNLSEKEFLEFCEHIVQANQQPSIVKENNSNNEGSETTKVSISSNNPSHENPTS